MKKRPDNWSTKRLTKTTWTGLWSTKKKCSFSGNFWSTKKKIWLTKKNFCIPKKILVKILIFSLEEKKCNLCLEAGKFRCHLGYTDLKSNLLAGWVGFRKYYVIFRVGHGKCLCLITRWVGGVKKGQKQAYVIFEWSPT